MTKSFIARLTFPGGDPRTFIPDTDTSTPQQVINWLEACRRWHAADAAGEQPSEEPVQDSSPSESLFGIGFQQRTIEVEENAAPHKCGSCPNSTPSLNEKPSVH